VLPNPSEVPASPCPKIATSRFDRWKRPCVARAVNRGNQVERNAARARSGMAAGEAGDTGEPGRQMVRNLAHPRRCIQKLSPGRKFGVAGGVGQRKWSTWPGRDGSRLLALLPSAVPAIAVAINPNREARLTPLRNWHPREILCKFQMGQRETSIVGAWGRVP